jgi:hypothetical protein
LEIVEIETGRFEVVAVTRSVAELKGMFGSPPGTVSMAEMNAAITLRGASAR